MQLAITSIANKVFWTGATAIALLKDAIRKAAPGPRSTAPERLLMQRLLIHILQCGTFTWHQAQDCPVKALTSCMLADAQPFRLAGRQKHVGAQPPATNAPPEGYR